MKPVKLDTCRKLRETEYVSAVNPLLGETVELYDKLDMAGPDPDSVAELLHAAEQAEASMEHRLYEVESQLRLIREMHARIQEHFYPGVKTSFGRELDARIDDFINLIESDRIFKDNIFDEDLLQLLVDFRIWDLAKQVLKGGNRVVTEISKALRMFWDNIRLLLSAIPGSPVESEFKQRIEMILGKEALKKLYRESVQTTLEEIEKISDDILKESLVSTGLDDTAHFSERSYLEQALNLSTLTTGGTTMVSISSTLVLAAGWHTISWSLLNLFVPTLFFVILPVFVLSMLGFHNRDIDKRKESIENAKKETHELVEQQVLPLTMHELNRRFEEERSIFESRILKQYFPCGGVGLETHDIRRAGTELDALKQRMTEYLRGSKRAWVPAPENIDELTRDALSIAVVLDSHIERTNRKLGLNVNTLRAGSAGVIQQLSDRGLVNEEELDTLHWARRVRNHVTHRIGNFMAKPDAIRKKQMEGMKKGLEILERIHEEKVEA